MIKRLILSLSFLLAVGLVISKEILYFQEPRLWAEEGTVYLKSAFDEGYRAMFMPQLGYYAFIPSVATYMATYLPLLHIPAFTQGVSLLFWIVLFILILGINKKEYSVKIKIPFLFSILFIFLRYPEVFLNTINLQFITPIILLVSILYSEEKLNKYQIIGIRILQFICLLNGILSILLMPYLLYRAVFLDKKYDLVGLYLVSIFIHLGMIGSYEGQSNFMWRIKENWNYLIEDYHKPLLEVIKNRKVYVLIFLIALIALYSNREEKRREEAATFLLILSAGVLIIFIDFTKLPEPTIRSRYLVIIYSVLYIVLQIIFQRKYYRYLFFWGVMLILYMAYKDHFKKESYCKECPKWSEEYQNIYTPQGAKVHPNNKNWIIKLEKKE